MGDGRERLEGGTGRSDRHPREAVRPGHDRTALIGPERERAVHDDAGAERGCPRRLVGRNSDDSLNIGLQMPAGVGADLIVTGNHQNCDEFGGSALFCEASTCAGATVCGEVPPAFHEPSFGAAFTPGLDEVKDVIRPFDIAGPRATDTVSCRNGGTETTQVAVTSSVRVNAGGSAVHTPPGGKHIPTIERQKIFAEGDLLPTIFRAEAACGTVALGTTALVWGTTVPGVGGAAAIAADLLLVGSGPDCFALIDRIYDDARIVNDPPRRDFRKVAKPRPVRTPVAMPACQQGARSPRRILRRTAHRRAQPMSPRYATRRRSPTPSRCTVDRESGAAHAGAGAALKLQERTDLASSANSRSPRAPNALLGRRSPSSSAHRASPAHSRLRRRLAGSPGSRRARQTRDHHLVAFRRAASRPRRSTSSRR